LKHNGPQKLNAGKLEIKVQLRKQLGRTVRRRERRSREVGLAARAGPNTTST